MNIAFFTLGCKVNQFETQALGIMLSELGHSITDDFSSADVIVINTCTVTAVSDHKSRRAIRKLKKDHPHAKIAVCGCLSQINPDSIRSIGGVDLICGTSDRREFAKSIDALSIGKQNNFTPDNALRRRKFESLPAGGLHGHTRAMLKIEDGCSNFCSYCIIPYTRGPVRSLPPESVLEEAKRLSDKGYREIVLTGIEISSYGHDLKEKTPLFTLVSALCKAYPDIRFRLGSIEPRTITEEFCKALCGYANLCPQFHLSMQSGCDSTLARMRRKYDTSRFFESVSLLREYFPGCAITTDMIVGFPGESESEFSETLLFIKKCNFSAMHIFPYSKREGTPAAKMSGQLTKSEKASRAERAGKLAEEMKVNYHKSRINSTLRVLFEEFNNGLWSGHSENYIRVYAKSNENLQNKFENVLISDLYADGIFGQIVSPKE